MKWNVITTMERFLSDQRIGDLRVWNCVVGVVILVDIHEALTPDTMGWY
jgi:hypothetical protein